MTRVTHIQPIATGGKPPVTGYIHHSQILQRSVFGVQCSVFSHTHHSDPEPNWYIYHSDHLGSSSFLTDAAGNPTQHLQYLPFGENYIEQRATTDYYTPYIFSAKERDPETGYSYFGARYYDPNVSVWLSVDPMADKYPSMSAYMYCAGNPVMLVDPDGQKIKIYYYNKRGKLRSKRYREGMKANTGNPVLDQTIIMLNTISEAFSDDGSFSRMVNDKHKVVQIFTTDLEISDGFYQAMPGLDYDDENQASTFVNPWLGTYGERLGENGYNIVFMSSPVGALAHELGHIFSQFYLTKADRSPRTEEARCVDWENKMADYLVAKYQVKPMKRTIDDYYSLDYGQFVTNGPLTNTSDLKHDGNDTSYIIKKYVKDER
jgi:RHS repeat-associated protein